MRGRGLAAAAVALSAVVAWAPSGAQADYDDCGELPVYSNTTKIIKVKRMDCDAGQKLAHKFEKVLRSGSSIVPGDHVRIRNFDCELDSFFDPLDKAYTCRNSGRKKKTMRAIHPPERTPRAGDVDCSDFDSRKQAQKFFKKHGGSKKNDPYGLDTDHDGKACETLPK